MAQTGDKRDDPHSMTFREVVTPRVAVWYLVIALGLLFFWMNSGSLPERAAVFSVMDVYTFNERYCDMGIVLGWMNDDWNGVDTRKKCPSCPCVQYPINYGKGVLWLGRLGFHRFSVADKNWLAPIIIVVFLLLTAFVFEATRYWHVLYYGLLLFTPAICLAVERANLDLAMFCCVVAAVLVAARYGPGYGYGIVFFAATLKLYPIAGILAFLNRTRRNWYYLLAAAGGMVFFLILTWDYQPFGRMLGSMRISWGYPVIFDLSPVVFKNLGWPQLGARLGALTSLERMAILGLWFAPAAMVTWYARQRLASFLETDRTKRRQFFLLGCSIYSFCFAAGSNVEYRSIFILLMAPYLLQAGAAPEKGKRHLARFGQCLVLSVFISTWFRNYDWFVPFEHACYWLLFGFCGSLCLAALFACFPGLREPAPMTVAPQVTAYEP